MSNPTDVILQYHQRTKHHFHAYAAGPGRLSWATQPDPFRRYDGAPQVPLPRLPERHQPTFAALPAPPTSVEPVTLETISRLFRNALAVSAWKRHQASRWALRVNPSSGNLHPTECYLITDDLDAACPAGVYHYAPKEHLLERRGVVTSEGYRALTAGFAPGTMLVALSSIPWREAWKYGERAFRYCQHDVGHALAALRYSARILGWHLQLLDTISDDTIRSLAGLDAGGFHPQEPEYPELLCALLPHGSGPQPGPLVVDGWRPAWQGTPNVLSAGHHPWPVVDEAARASEAPPRPPVGALPPNVITSAVSLPDDVLPAERIIQRRRSATDFDGVTSITKEQLWRMLSRTLTAAGAPPWDVLAGTVMAEPRVHLVLFVHRVVGMHPGVYLLLRRADDEEALRKATRPEFLWEAVPGCPLPLFLLLPADTRDAARAIGCHQDIAADGAFSLGMIARYDEPIRTHGAWLYRRLFWEAGVIGQVLYLEAEACRVRATGMGCFFDDGMHQLLGFSDATFQDLYHLAVGGPVEDTRITTEPAYP
ncbi:MAG: nitroreductase family protein [Myxococcota bacterium]